MYPLVNVYKKLWTDSLFLMAKSTISMAMFNSYVTLPEGKFSEYEYVKYVNSNSSDLSSGKHGWKMLHFTSMIAF